MTLNNSWGYQKDDDNWKEPSLLVEQLVEIVSKGGNFLLNVGPTAEGVIPEPSVERLKEVGAWLKVNGEAIYGAGPSPFVTEPKGNDLPAWRCTTKPGKLFLHLLKWPGARFELSGVKSTVAKAYLLGDRQPLQFTQANDSLSVVLPQSAPVPLANVLCLDLQQ